MNINLQALGFRKKHLVLVNYSIILSYGKPFTCLLVPSTLCQMHETEVNLPLVSSMS